MPLAVTAAAHWSGQGQPECHARAFMDSQGVHHDRSPAAHAPHLAVSGDEALPHHKVQDLAQQALGVVAGVVEQDLLRGRGEAPSGGATSGWRARPGSTQAAAETEDSTPKRHVRQQGRARVELDLKATRTPTPVLTCLAMSGSDTMTNCLGPKDSLKTLP